MSNISSSPSLDCAHFSINVAVSYLLLFTFPISLLLNGVAAWVSLHLQSTSTFIVYLKNLVAADLLMTLTLPLMAASMIPGASIKFRAFTCRYSDVIFYCCLYTSIALMSLIGLDRFFKIVIPCRHISQSLVFSIIMSSSIWLVLFGGTAIPTMILTNRDPVNTTGNFCMSLKGPDGVTFHNYVVLFMDSLFWFASLLIVFCYVCITLKVLRSYKNSGSSNSNGKKKTKLRVFLILVVFCVCFVPLHIMRIPYTLHETFNLNACAKMWIKGLCNIALWVSTTNSCLDPILYVYLCKEYKVKLIGLMKATGVPARLYSGETEEMSH